MPYITIYNRSKYKYSLTQFIYLLHCNNEVISPPHWSVSNLSTPTSIVDLMNV